MKNQTDILSLKFVNSEISILEFQTELFKLDGVNQLFEELILLDFNSKYIKHDAFNLIQSILGKAKIETYNLTQLLKGINDKTNSTLRNLIQTYDLRCKGYWFLEELGIHLALNVISTRDEPINEINDLSKGVQQEYFENILPKAITEAKRVLDQLSSKKIIVTGETLGSLNRKCWIDNRSENEIDSKELDTIRFHSKSSDKIRETKMKWLQGGPLLEISTVKTNQLAKEKIIEQELSNLRLWNPKFLITIDNETYNSKLNEFKTGYVDQGKTNRVFNVNCQIDLIGKRKAVFQIEELSDDLYSTNLYMFGSRISANEWNELGVTKFQEGEIISMLKDLISITKPIVLALGYEDDCISFFDTENTYPSVDYQKSNINVESIRSIVLNSENGFEYCYIQGSSFKLNKDIEIRKTA
jgi:hypothetical protein